MREFRQVFWGMLVALISAGIILGSISIALIEGGMSAAFESTPTLFTRLVTQPIPSIFPPQISTPTDTEALLLTTPLSVTSSPFIRTPSATPRCQHPSGWSTYEIQPGDSLSSIAEKFNTTEKALVEANCLEFTTLIPGTYLYVPYVYPTTAVVQCGPPRGWVFYTVKPGDNLYRIALSYNVTVSQLQLANCMGSSTLIRIGQKLYVPNVPTRTPMQDPSDTPTLQPSSTVTIMPSITAAATLTPTHLPTATNTATIIPTLIPTFTPTTTSTTTSLPTHTSTVTDVPTTAPTQTQTPTSTNTNLPPTQVPTSTQTATPLPPTATSTPVPPTPTATPTPP